MNLLLFVLSLFIALTSSVMVHTQYRRFWHPFRSIKDFGVFLSSRKEFMAYTNVRPIGHQLGLVLANGAQFKLGDAISQLLTNDSHTLIVCYKSYQVLKKGFREYGSHNKTPQIWSHFELAGGPGGYEVDDLDARQAVNHDFTDNRILAVAWTQPVQWTKNMKYNKSHVTEMGIRVAKGYKPNRLMVLELDAILLSNTPEMTYWMQEPMSKMPVLIRLIDHNRHKEVNVLHLMSFINATEMWPYFFDLPVYIHYALVNNNKRFTTVEPAFYGDGMWERGSRGFVLLVSVVHLIWG